MGTTSENRGSVHPNREIEIFVEHSEAELFPPDELRVLCFFAIGQEPAGHDLATLAVLLTGAERIRALHRDFMGLDTDTDIMTFPADLEPGRHGRGGDLVISVDAARDNGFEIGHSTWDEVRFLVVHGILHLCGWDDHDERDREAMLSRQSEIIARFDALG